MLGLAHAELERSIDMYLLECYRKRQNIIRALKRIGCSKQNAVCAAKNAIVSNSRPWYVKLYYSIKWRLGLIFDQGHVNPKLVKDLHDKKLLYISLDYYND